MVVDCAAAEAVSVDRATFVATMGAVPTGVTIVTSLDSDGTPRGLTCNAFSSVSVDPPLLLVCVDKRSATLGALRASGRFAVNFLASGRDAVATLFATKAEDKFANIRWAPSRSGMPILIDDAIAYAVCSTVQEIESGDHYIFIGRVEEVQPPRPDDEPLVYFRRKFGVVRHTS